jgi:hypothetical protein
MPPFGPVSRRDFIRYLRKAGFEGPFHRARHDLMVRGDIRISIPNPHAGDIGKN